MGFAPSLHPLSIVDGIRASARRTPGRIAVCELEARLSYSELMEAASATEGRAHASSVVRWLAALMAERSDDENRPALPLATSHRTVVLRALDFAVLHPVFDREGAIASTLPVDGESGMVAATLALWLGSSLHLIEPASVIEGISAGTFEACWVHERDCFWLEGQTLARPSEKFRLLACEGATPAQLVSWLGRERVCEAP